MKRNKNYKSGTRKFVPSLLFCIFSYLIFTLVASFILLKTAESSAIVPISSLIVFLISGAVSGIFISRYKGEGGVKFTALSTLTFVLILTLISLVMSRGQLKGSLLMNYFCYLLVGILFSALARKRTGRHIKRHR